MDKSHKNHAGKMALKDLMGALSDVTVKRARERKKKKGAKPEAMPKMGGHGEH